MANSTNYADEYKNEIEAGDTITLTSESEMPQFDGELEITAATQLASETLSDKPGFEQETDGRKLQIATEGDNPLMLVFRTLNAFDARDDVIAHIKFGEQEVAKVTDIAVEDN